MIKKRLFIAATITVIATGYWFYLNNREVQVIDAHYDIYTAAILVKALPLSKSASIDWWLKNQASIMKKYHIPSSSNGGPDYFTIYAFGDGYKKQGKKDRLCFRDMTPPTNCIDKKILMTINRNRHGETRFSFDYSSWIKTKNGEMIAEPSP